MKEILKGTVTAQDGLREVLEIIGGLKDVNSCVLQVSLGNGAGGLIGLRGSWHITGAMLHSGEIGRGALRKILEIRQGSFQVLDTGPEPLPPLRQGLKIALDNVLPYLPNDIHPKVTPWLFDYSEIIEAQPAPSQQMQTLSSSPLPADGTTTATTPASAEPLRPQMVPPSPPSFAPATPASAEPLRPETAPPLPPSFAPATPPSVGTGQTGATATRPQQPADNAVGAQQPFVANPALAEQAAQMQEPAALLTWSQQKQLTPAAPRTTQVQATDPSVSERSQSKIRFDLSRSRLQAVDIQPEFHPSSPSRAITRLKIAGAFFLFAFALVAPFIMLPVFLMKALCLALFACAFNLLLGFVGLLSFGHAAFFGTAAYVAGYAAKTWGTSPELCLLSGTVAAMLLGSIIGCLAIRRQGMYFAMITLAMSQLVYYICFESPFTGGDNGLQDIPRGKLFGLFSLADDRSMYFFVLAIFIVGFALIFRIIHSPFGQVLKAIRENEPRAVSLGYDTDRYKLIAFVLSSSISGLAGATKALSVQLVPIADVHFNLSGQVVLMTLLGGLGTLLGPVVGAFLISAVDLGDWVQMVVGVTFIICLLFFRSGVVGSIAQLLRWHQRIRIRARLRPERAAPR